MNIRGCVTDASYELEILCEELLSKIEAYDFDALADDVAPLFNLEGAG